jgi:NADH dehydrogenase
MSHHVVILGGSYGGIAAMRRLSGYPDLQITLIDQHPYHFLQTESYELISSNTSFEETIVSLPALAANYDHVTYLHQHIKSINLEQKSVSLDEGECHYDSLIIALGSITKRFQCHESVYNYSGGPKSLRGALRLNQFFQTELYKRLESTEKAKENFNIVVGGAGLSGVEIAAGMQYYFNRYYRSNALSCATLHIHLIASRETVLYGMHPKIIEIATKRLRKLHVILHTQNRITAIDRHNTLLSDGTRIPFDFMIFAGGTMPVPCIQELDVKKNKKGQCLINDFLQLPEFPDVYAVGDCAALKDKHGKTLPPTAQTAIQSGEMAAENITRIHKKDAPRKADVSLKGIAIALGGKYAAIDLVFVRIKGYPAYLIKKLIERLYKWPLKWQASRGFHKIKSCSL